MFASFENEINTNYDIMRQLFSLLFCAVCVISAYAVPAHPGAKKILQPDGTYVTVKLHGDEFFHYTTTADGYTIERNDQGYYVYLAEIDGDVAQSTVIAHDEEYRTDEENEFLNITGPRLLPTDAVSDAQITKAAANAQYVDNGILTSSASVKSYDYNNFRGLVILAEFSDRSFSRDDISEVFTNMVNQEGYEGVPSTDGTYTISYTGSVRDYFSGSSNGAFTPTFDIVGPYTLSYSSTYANGYSNGHTLARAVLNAANADVDFSDYDGDGDGVVDMFYIIYAGYGSNYSGNNSKYIWPYASSLTNTSKDGVSMGRYACSVEMYGWESEGNDLLEGIGIMCHEFSHVLGLSDVYDTDYDESGGTSEHPDTWSIMALGEYLNYGRTPPSWCLFERYQAGLATPTTITSNGEYTIEPLSTSNAGYRIDSSVNKEYFLLENRRKTGWDMYLEGAGMLVWRVDSTSTSVWTNNTINANPEHMYFELIRAQAQYDSDGTIYDSSYDPFPGSGKVTSLTNSSDPSIQSWTGADTSYEILSITQAASGDITITVGQDNSSSLIEDFENMSVFTGDAEDVEGNFVSWNFVEANVMNATSSNGNGNRVARFYKSGYITSAAFSVSSLVQVSFKGWNENSLRNGTVHLYVSTDYGTSWTEYFQDGVSTASSLKAGNSAVSFTYPIGLSGSDMMIKIMVDGGLGSYYVTLDDITLTYTGELSLSGITDIFADESDDSLSVATSGTTASITSTSNANIYVFDEAGTLVKVANCNNGTADIDLPQHGVYILKQGSNARKIAL